MAKRLTLLLTVLLLTGGQGWMPRALHAGSDIDLMLPNALGRTFNRNSGLQLRIKSSWLEASGYRPVTVEVLSVTPTLADRVLTIQITPSDWTTTREGVQFDLKLPEGAARASIEVAIPQHGPWQQLSIETIENGDQWDDLSGSVGPPRYVPTYEWTEAFPAILFVSKAAPPPPYTPGLVNQKASSTETTLPNIGSLVCALPPYDDYVRSQGIVPAIYGGLNSNTTTKQQSDSEILNLISRLQTMHVLPPDLLPTQRINYSSVDFVLISLPDLQDLVANQPDTWQAIRDHIKLGGMMIVSGIGDQFENLAQLEDLVAIPPSSSETTDTSQPAGLEAWVNLDVENAGERIDRVMQRDAVVRSYQRTGVYEETIDGETDDLERGRIRDKLGASKFRHRSVGLGKVVALTESDLSNVDTNEWAWFFNDLGSGRWRWYLRHGFSWTRRNRDFWDFLIPGVGAAPVKGFLAVITLFMIIIGPINYWLLGRAKRLYLLLVTVPVSALLVTACLYGYAIVKDGFGTQARLRSYSEILPNGQAASWSRQSYYAGLAPSSGLVYPKSATVMPLDADPEVEHGRRRILRWATSQYLETGYLRSRSTAQVLVQNLEAADQPMTITPAPDGTSLTVTHEWNANFKALLVFDDEQVYWADQVAPGSATLKPVERSEASKQLISLLSSYQTGRPTGFDVPNSRRRRPWLFRDIDGGFASPNFNTSLQEQGISQLLSDLSVENPLTGRREFVVFTETAPPFVPIGAKRARQVAGFHVIRGSW